MHSCSVVAFILAWVGKLSLTVVSHPVNAAEDLGARRGCINKIQDTNYDTILHFGMNCGIIKTLMDNLSM